jgi:hypothetical protein
MRRRRLARRGGLLYVHFAEKLEIGGFRIAHPRGLLPRRLSEIR